MTEQMVRVSSAWLALREPADAAARASDLVILARTRLARASRVVVHDLGCGTGSMGRWLAPQLPGSQHWIMYDRDRDLLERVVADMPDTSADGLAVTAEARHGDVTSLTAEDFRGAGLLTASALLDLLTADEVERIVAACVGAGCPALLTLSVTGQVNLTPSDPLDTQIAAAFNGHQRRTTNGRRLLGPDAVGATVDAFTRRGAVAVVRPSPWRLGADDPVLMSEWLSGWLTAACDQRPALADSAVAYAQRRLAERAEGRLEVVVHHQDVFAHCE